MRVWVKGSHGIPAQYGEIVGADQCNDTGMFGYIVVLSDGRRDFVGVDMVAYPNMPDVAEPTRTDNPSMHQTAISRKGMSRPAKAFLDQIASVDETILDFGCGHGEDVAHLRAYGFSQATGFDPFSTETTGACSRRSPFSSDKQYDNVMSNYVLNVLENQNERVDVVQDAFDLVAPGGKLFISARSPGDVSSQKKSSWKRHKDGHLTTTGSFQKGISKQELYSIMAQAGIPEENIEFVSGPFTGAIAHKEPQRTGNPYGYLLTSDTRPEDAGAFVYYQPKKPNKQQILSMLFLEPVHWVMEKGRRGYFSENGEYVGASFANIVDERGFTDEEIFDAVNAIQAGQNKEIGHLLAYMDDYERIDSGDAPDIGEFFPDDAIDELPPIEEVSEALDSTYQNLEDAFSLIEKSANKTTKKNIVDALEFARQGMESRSFDAQDLVYLENILKRKKGKKTKIPPTQAEIQFKDPNLVDEVVDLAIEQFELDDIDSPELRLDIAEEAKQLASHTDDVFEAVSFATSHVLFDLSKASDEELRMRRGAYLPKDLEEEPISDLFGYTPIPVEMGAPMPLPKKTRDQKMAGATPYQATLMLLKEAFDIGSSGEGPVFDLRDSGLEGYIKPDYIEGIIDRDGFAHYPKTYGINAAMEDLAQGFVTLDENEASPGEIEILKSLSKLAFDDQKQVLESDEETLQLLSYALNDGFKSEIWDEVDFDALDEAYNKIKASKIEDESKKEGFLRVPANFVRSFEKQPDVLEELHEKFEGSAIYLLPVKDVKRMLRNYFEELNAYGVYDRDGDFGDAEQFYEYDLAHSLFNNYDDVDVVDNIGLYERSEKELFEPETIDDFLSMEEGYFVDEYTRDLFLEAVENAKKQAKETRTPVSTWMDFSMPDLVVSTYGELDEVIKLMKDIYPNAADDILKASLRDHLERDTSYGEYDDEDLFLKEILIAQLDGASKKELVEIGKKHGQKSEDLVKDYILRGTR